MKLTFVNYCWNEIVLTPSLSTSQQFQSTEGTLIVMQLTTGLLY